MPKLRMKTITIREILEYLDSNGGIVLNEDDQGLEELLNDMDLSLKTRVEA